MDIVVTFNTKTKDCVATIDGKAVDNLTYVSFYGNYKGKFSCEVTSGTTDDENNMSAYTRVCASEGGDTLVNKAGALTQELKEEILNSWK